VLELNSFKFTAVQWMLQTWVKLE